MPDLVRFVSTNLQVTPETPPTFLILANDDDGVSPENSILFYLALRHSGVPAEIHICQAGGHGFGGTWQLDATARRLARAKAASRPPLMEE